MKPYSTKLAVLATFIYLVCATAWAADQHAHSGPIELSPELTRLLRAEMAELSGAVQTVAAAIAAGDWEAVESTSAKMHDSYIMRQSLTPAQAAELNAALPEHFKHLDGAFHARSRRLGEAAAKHDAELAAFQFSRLLEACAQCHAAYASERFPGFSRQDDAPHGH